VIESLPVRISPQCLIAYWMLVSRTTATCVIPASSVTKRLKSIVDEAIQLQRHYPAGVSKAFKRRLHEKSESFIVKENMLSPQNCDRLN